MPKSLGKCKLNRTTYFNDELGVRCALTERGLVYDVGHPLRTSDRIEIETALGCTLPEDYWSWLMEFNGGSPSWGEDKEVWYTETNCDDGSADTLDRLFGWRHPRFDLRTENTNSATSRPKDFIAIGFPNQDNRQRLLLLGGRGTAIGSVYDWYRPASKKKGPNELHLVSGSFHEFWTSLLDRHPHAEE